MLVYLEFISRRPGVGLHEFHAVVGGGQSGWAGDYGDDLTVLNVGRSWRIGPEPEYLCAWYTPTASVDRLDEWERVFRSGDADAYEAAVVGVGVAADFEVVGKALRLVDAGYEGGEGFGGVYQVVGGGSRA